MYMITRYRPLSVMLNSFVIVSGAPLSVCLSAVRGLFSRVVSPCLPRCPLVFPIKVVLLIFIGVYQVRHLQAFFQSKRLV